MPGGVELRITGMHEETLPDGTRRHRIELEQVPPPNPVGPTGLVEPLPDYRAAFMNNDGNIIGFARVDIIDGPEGTQIKVRP